jgi:hypothetical protein
MLRHNSIYAAFPSVRDAERAAGALLDHGVHAASVSFIVPHGAESPPIVAGTPHMPGVVPVSPTYMPADLPVPDVSAPAPAPTAAIDLNTGVRVGEDVSVTHTAPGYRYDALGDQLPDVRTAVPTTYTPPADRYDPIPVNTPLRSSPDVVQTAMQAMAADAPIDVVEADRVHILDTHRTEPHAASGITTTTGRDAAKGAVEGAGIGLGLGALLGLAAIAIPGVGWVAGAGALVAGLAAATGAAGAVAGGAYGFLADLGLPPHYTQQLQTHLETGGPVLSVHLSDGVPETEVIQLLEKYGATSAQAF